MNVNIIVATKGRPIETYHLLTYLMNQSYPVHHVAIVGHEDADVTGLERHPMTEEGRATLHLSPMGSCHQRNTGLEIIAKAQKEVSDKDWIAVFFDDDFRPAEDWVENCVACFNADKSVVGMTGYVIADGVTTGGYDEKASLAYLNKETPAVNANQPLHEVVSLYGCNMAFLGTYACTARFDENLPLYAWLEDVDYSYQALATGKLVYAPNCVGVHMGVSSGRTSGVRFGYSQIANPAFLIAKGTMPVKQALLQLTRNVLSNLYNTVLLNRKHRERLYGNLCAMKDIMLFRCKPNNILDIK